MNDSPPRPICFVAMPFGRKKPPGKKGPVIDFDAIYGVIEGAVKAAGLDCIRADFEPYGGFVHRHMYERLLVAEYVVADLTYGNANVAYEVGVRHGGSAGSTVLICEEASMGSVGFDFRPFRILPYRLTQAGSMSRSAAVKFASAMTERLRSAAEDTYPTDNPLLQLTDWEARQDVAHSKTDVFLKRMAYASKIGARVADVLATAKVGDPVARLNEIEHMIFPEDGSATVVVQLHTALIALYLGYREIEASGEMVRLFGQMPPELQRKSIVREQLAFAFNRIAEAHEKQGRRAEAAAARQRALMSLDQIPAAEQTSETLGIRGRIHKGWFEAEESAGNTAPAVAQLKRAIAVYEEGFKLDPRDYYPGVNAVTLRVRRATEADRARAIALAPVVRFAVERAPAPKDDSERYWQTATRLELAAVAADWDSARDLLTDLLAIPVAPWMHATTAKNFEILKRAHAADPAATAQIETVLAALRE